MVPARRTAIREAERTELVVSAVGKAYAQTAATACPDVPAAVLEECRHAVGVEVKRILLGQDPYWLSFSIYHNAAVVGGEPKLSVGSQQDVVHRRYARHAGKLGDA